MLPPLTQTGVLPPGEHAAAWDELVARFGGTPRRDRLLNGLHRAGLNLRAAGARAVWLGGSLVTAKDDPEYFDGIWDPSSVEVDLTKVDPVLVDIKDLANGRLKQKAKYGGELLTGSEAGCGLAIRRFFQQDLDGTPIGIVRLDLRTLQ